MEKSKIIIFIIIALVLIGGAAVVFLELTQENPSNVSLELNFWNVYDDSDVFEPLIKEFNKTYKKIKINYYKKSPTSYETELLNALAAGRGPDIFAIHNAWLPKHLDKLAPASQELMTIKDYRDTFVDVAFKDFIASPPSANPNEKLPEQIYAVPLFVDTLALYWNKDIFNTAGVAEPPKNWEEFVQVVPNLIKRDASGNIIQAGASLGTAKNINRSMDILYLLMLQTGTQMVNDDKDKATFDEAITVGDKTYKPGVDSLRFYTDFANPLKRVYTYNDKMDYSIDAFVEGESAMMINYAYHAPTIKAKEPHLRFGIAPVPQPKDGQIIINYANYWGLGVSAGSDQKKIQYAWVFLKWLSEQPQAKKYLELAKRPASRRDLVAWQESDLELGVFAQQSLSARSWYQADNLAIEKIFTEIIEAVNYGRLMPDEAVEQAARQTTLLMQR